MLLNKNGWKIALVTTVSICYFLNVFFVFGKNQILVAKPIQKEDFSPQAFYNNKCLACHANDGRPKRAGVPDLSLSEYQKSRSDDQIGIAIMNGYPPKMPAYKSKLDKEKLKGVVDYIRTFGRK